MNRMKLYLFRRSLLALIMGMALPLTAMADEIVVADANGNELTYSFDSADAPATFINISRYAADETKKGHIIIADAVTDANGNSHEVKYVGGNVYWRSYIRSIVFGKNIVSIGGPDGEADGAFSSCYELTEVTLNAKLETIGRSAFQNCTYLRNINLAEMKNLKTIKYSAFMDADRLPPITLPASVTTMEDRAFWGIDSLKSFTFAPGSQLTAIPATCFAHCTSLETLTLPDGIQTIGAEAFYNCASLTEITFGTQLTSFANNWSLFGYCQKLRKVVLPGATFPFTGSFWLPDDCTLYVNPALLNTYRESEFTRNYHVMVLGQPTDFSVTTTAGGQLQSKVEAIGLANNVLSLTVSGPLNGTDIDYIHSAMPNLEVLNLTNASIVPGGDSYHQWNVSANGTATIETYYGPWNTEANVVGYAMFYNMPTLQSISLPKGTTKIGEYACAQDRNHNFKLKHIDIPSGVTEIGHHAFYYTGIEEATVPAGITRLEEYTFHHCHNLKKAVLPDGITFIGNSVFSECYELEDVNMPASIETIDAYAFYNNQKKTVPIVLPSTLKRIGTHAFQNNYKVRSITFNEGLESIGSYAFSNCNSVEAITLPETVTTIESNAFEGCDSITQFTFPTAITTVPSAVLYHCDKLQKVTLAEGTTKIEYNAFDQCPRLNAININQPTLTYIGNYAFQNTAFTTMTLPDQISEMGSAVFQSCQNLESINVPTGIDYVPYDFCEGCPKLKSVQMHDGIRIVHYDAFWDCKLLTAIDLNDQITSIENTAFRGCESLASFSTTSQTVALPSALTFIGHNAFLNAKALTGTINVPEGVTEIEYNAFDGTSITAATLPDGLTRLGTGIFANTPNLASVKLPATITRIPNYTFQRATALKSINLPETVREIGYCAFEYSGLESIELPDSLEVIETYAFGSSQLRTIRIPDDTKTVQWGFAQNSKHLKSAYLGRNMNYGLINDFNYFYECDSLELIRIFAGTPPGISEWYTRHYRTNCVLEVPEDQVALYKETDIWKEFKEIRGFFMGDVLDDLDYAVLCKLYREADGKNWKNIAWDMTNNHHAAGKWPGVTTNHIGNSKTYFITAISLPEKGLSGNLPDSLFLLPRLKTLDLSNNALRGDIGAFRACEGSPLTEVNLKGNRLSGDLYPFAAQLPNVTKLDVSYNQLTDLSQPIPKGKLTDLNTSMQFIDPVTFKVRADGGSPAVITDITPGIPTDIPLPTIMTYNHDAQNYSRVPSDLARIYNNGSNFAYDWELRKNGDGLWDLYQDNTNYVLRAPKGEVVAYTNHASWSEYHTVLVRFDWQDGDVNADQTVDVSDLQSVIYYALRDRKPESQMFNYTTADANSDQTINVSDVIGSVDYVLGYEAPAGARGAYVVGHASQRDNATSEATEVAGIPSLLTVNGATVTLSAASEVAALQLTITGCSKSQVVVNSDLRSRFSVSMRDMSDGVRIVVYSASGKTLPVGDHELFTIAQPNYALCTMNCELSDVRLTDAQARRLPVTILDATAAVPSLVIESQQIGEVFDLSGRPVGPWHTLPSGIYVIKVNGKQFKVKK